MVVSQNVFLSEFHWYFVIVSGFSLVSRYGEYSTTNTGQPLKAALHSNEQKKSPKELILAVEECGVVSNGRIN